MKKYKNTILKDFIIKNAWVLLLVLVIILLSNSCRVGAASLVQKIVDILAKSQTNGIGNLFLVVAVAAIIMIMFYVTRLAVQIICEYLSQKLAMQTRVRLFEHLAKIPFRLYEEYATGNIQSILRNDVSTATSIIYIIFARLVSNIMLIVFSAGFMISINAGVGIIVTLITLSLGFLNNKMLRTFKKYQIAERKSIGDLSAVVESSCRGMDTIKTYNAKEYILDFFKGQKERYNKSSFCSEKVDAARLSIYNFIQNICLYGSMLFLGYLGIRGDMSIGQVVVFITVLHDFMMPVEVTLRFVSRLVTAGVAWGRIYDLLNLEESSQQSKQSADAYESIGELELNNICYSYDGKKNILDNFFIKLKKGCLNVLMGRSGSGKSTFLKIMVGLYDSNDGEFKIDNKQANKDRLYKSSVYVSSNNPLFAMSIYDNIALGDNKITRQMCMDLAKELGIDEWINSLPDGLDTIVTENAKNISGGQQQIINNMRALLSDAAVIIIDEPDSALDKQKESLLYKVIDRVKYEKIVLITSHRTDVTKYSDNMYNLSRQ